MTSRDPAGPMGLKRYPGAKARAMARRAYITGKIAPKPSRKALDANYDFYLTMKAKRDENP